jgi:hypothetical protein
VNAEGIAYGVYFLKPTDGKKQTYIGHMMGNFCSDSGMQIPMSCNVVVVSAGGAVESKEVADLKKSHLLPEALGKSLPRCNALPYGGGAPESACPGKGK